MAETSLFEQIGGDAAVDLAVVQFYDKVLADNRVKHFFEGVDMAKQIKMQGMFLKYAFGGPFKYNGKNMRAAHRRLVRDKGMNDSHFDAIVELLGATLKELGVDQSLIAQVALKCETLRDDILCKDEVIAPKAKEITTQVNNKSNNTSMGMLTQALLALGMAFGALAIWSMAL